MLRYYVKNKFSGTWNLIVALSILLYVGNATAQCPTLSAVVNGRHWSIFLRMDEWRNISRPNQCH
jgi:hypothetical protein